MKRFDKEGIVALAFESSTVEELEVIDAVRVAMMGDFDKQCGYPNSSRLVVKIKTGEKK